MAAFPDLGSIDYFPVADPQALRAVGWLARGQEFRCGEVGREIFAQLCQLLVSPWEPCASAGFHERDLCQFSGGTQQLRYGNVTVTMGSSNLFVPDQGRVWD